MNIINLSQRSESLIKQLTALWKKSVMASHDFLSLQEIEQIEQYVPQALVDIPTLYVAYDEQQLCAFIGIVQQKIEMLFVEPEYFGNGIGKTLLNYVIENHQANEVTVNEQNPSAKGFYQHMGFEVYKRTELDEQGNPYPLLYMTRK